MLGINLMGVLGLESVRLRTHQDKLICSCRLKSTIWDVR